MNPFKVLNIDGNVSKKEIVQALAVGLREKKYSAKELAQAQKMLLDPDSRAVKQFLHLIDLEPLKAQLDIRRPAGLGQEDVSHLTRLDIFDAKA